MNTYKNYIDLLRNILKNFDNNEFDYVIKKILIKMFNDYYMNRNDKIYCIDNLYKKYYIGRYYRIKKKYGVVKNCDLIFRFNRYTKKCYIIKLLKKNFHVILDEGQTYDNIASSILEKDNIKNYKRYIDDLYIEKYFERLNCKKDYCKKVDNDVKKDNIFGEKICFYPPCLDYVSNNNYCHLHHKNMI